jgi:hypothetical protein
MTDLQKIQRRIEDLMGKRLLATGARRDRITVQMRKLRADRDLLVLELRDAQRAA